MPLFRVEGGRSVVVHPLQPASGTFEAELPSVVADHLDTLVGEPLLLVRERPDGADEPSLLAVDGGGRAVVVELVPVLDGPALLTALRHAGRACRLGSRGLAQAYRGGAEHFEAHLAAVRDVGPASSRSASCRLLIVCGEIIGVEDELDLLRSQTGLQVLLVGVLHGAAGERWLDVSPPGRLVRRSPDVEIEDWPEPAPNGHVSAGSVQPAWPPVPPPPVPMRGPQLDPAPTGTAELPSIPVAEIFALVPPPPGAPTTPLPRRSSALHREPERLVVVPVAADARPDPVVATADHARPMPGLPYAFTGVLPPEAMQPAPDPRLVALARSLGRPTVLVWHRARRGVAHEALLHLDGTIELPDGGRFTDPSVAAETAGSVQSVVDGWRAWRVERPTGPSLADACAGHP